MSGTDIVGNYYYIRSENSMGFSCINDTDEKHSNGILSSEWSHYKILDQLIRFMRKREFTIKHDKSVHRCIRKDHWVGRKGELRFVMRRYPSGFSIDFFQEIVTENKAGGRYDFNKYKKCPYLIKLSWINETNKMAFFLDSFGIANGTKKQYELAEDRIKNDFVDSWHHPQKDMNFNLKDLHGTTCEGNYNNTDRDGKTIYNGQVKYFRNYKGRLMRGAVYHNINNMWWVILDRFEYTNIADFDLFDPTDDDFKIRRKARVKKPKEYHEKLESLDRLSNKDLLRELKKRGLRVS